MYFIVSNKKKILMIAVCLMVMLSGCSTTKEESVSATGFYFDTVIQIQITHREAEELKNQVFQLCQELELIFDKTVPDSELYRLNHRQVQQVEVSDSLAKVISIGLEYSEKTQGAFDITICPVTDLWDFQSEDPKIPSEEEVRQALDKVDYKKVHINGNTVSFDSPDIQLDLGALAKGYAADEVKEYLVSQGVASGYLNFGGNVQTIGCRTDGYKWNIGIQKPFSDRGTVLDIVEVQDQSVVSAGVYERYFEYEGKLYFHIIDPKTGYPVKTDLDQMTVICSESVIGDVLSTCCILLGEEEAETFVLEIGFSNVWLHLGDRCAMIKQ